MPDHEPSPDQPGRQPLARRSAARQPAAAPVANAEHAAVVAEIVARDGAILDRLSEA